MGTVLSADRADANTITSSDETLLKKVEKLSLKKGMAKRLSEITLEGKSFEKYKMMSGKKLAEMRAKKEER